MTAMQIVLLIFLGLLFAGFVCFLVALAKFYLTPVVGEFIFNLDPSKDADGLYEMKLEQHPLEWKKKKSVRFKIVLKE